ncbi:hypothetical protein EBO34_13330 [Alteribacter keqinensis]|uniref:Uncharacterized protein n=1 Tax=Alteribacter keqinensis TaxID=2483800 RepID=A0A3M7TQF7_9BACI|nr:hypothetical protein EBO34_13330 [Alteribacter keqinensis]
MEELSLFGFCQGMGDVKWFFLSYGVLLIKRLFNVGIFDMLAKQGLLLDGCFSRRTEQYPLILTDRRSAGEKLEINWMSIWLS